eukprot:10224-Heterococcus_DN1.PRE.1
MRYLLSIGLPVSADTLSVMLAAAGARDQLAAAQWLRQQGAPWPEEYLMFVDGNSAQNWSDEAVAWARSEGFLLALLSFSIHPASCAHPLAKVHEPFMRVVQCRLRSVYNELRTWLMYSTHMRQKDVARYSLALLCVNY